MGCAARWMKRVKPVTELSPTDFAEFFNKLWDHPPFAWQQALADRVLERAEAPWPEAIALPTAAGKTACLDIAVFALAVQASRLARKQAITAPRRIFFVVDRRVIVDQAYERARQLADHLEKAQDGILKCVADNLRQIAHGEADGYGEELPLAAYVLRGGMYRSEAWMKSPLQPMVVASTVDQIGSRLLFRAYGRGPKTWPIAAGLIANDSLILLDEAHCAQPFLQTLQAVRRYQKWGHTPLERPFYPVVMSATPPPGVDLFEDLSEESRNPDHPLGQRQLAHKPAILETVENAKGKQATSTLAKALAKVASELVNDERRAIVVFANRVATARETYCLLQNREDLDAVLLTGRMRPVDKDALVKQHLKFLESGQMDKRALVKPLIVVATQTLEVGADLDFDGLVTECASLDALRQRFGRLNRMGRPIEDRAAILVRGDQAGDTGDDPVYGEALTKTWNWLNEHKADNGDVDFGIAYLPDGDSSLNAPSVNAPVMLPAHVDCWAQTAPEPQPSPDVALFLHGPRESMADVQVCWRADLDLIGEKETSLELLSLCPPSSSETLPVPIGVFKRWLAGEDAADDSADVEGIGTEDSLRRNGSSTEERLVVRWRGAETEAGDITADPKAIRPGDVIVIPANHLGSARQLGDLPADADLDVGDRAYRLVRAKPILRLSPKLVDDWPDSVTAKGPADELLKDLAQKYDDDPHEVANALRELLQELADSESLPEHWSWLPKAAKELSKEYSGSKLARAYRVVGGKSIVLVGQQRISELTREADYFSDEDDAAASGIAHCNGQPVRLDKHLPGVEGFARRHAVGCGLPEDLVKAVACAGLLHDLGKADPRFQSMLRGGVRWSDGKLLAKSAAMPKTRAARRRAHADSGYPQGGRHELLSVRLAENGPGLLPESDDLRDLVLHLVASHHGHCRPFAPVVIDTQQVPVEYELNGTKMFWSGPTDLERLDSGVADRYWRLVRRYGWWGLAWLEALLRLADRRQSEWEETHNEEE
ncbi:MAG: type I-U CRISPR-associated helicase/endonuclease Cas3 [Gemmatimonadetes bacterium]|nr:type I-U CRISPR-associated helicase/endonuclease Cas3 [Gemmatimonadota bacterium]